MEEQLISFETAVLAKEKGFDIKTLYRFLGEIYREVDLNCQLWDNEYYAPTQSLLQKWLREVHGIMISVDIENDCKYFISLTIISPNSTGDDIWGDYKTYEEALEEGLLNGLKLI
jgi:hypothetical protein